MDMDIPDLEELQWLESHNSNYLEEEDIEYPASPPAEPEPPESPEPEPLDRKPEPTPIPVPASSKPTLSLPPKLSVENPQGNAKKRFRLDVGPEPIVAGDATDTTKEEKRIRVGVNGNGGGGEEDEDWLRYSPPVELDGGAEVAEDEEKERFLSRYATDIDGDCVPVTGLDGERVYAKICRVDDVERVKKLDVRGNLEGLF